VLVESGCTATTTAVLAEHGCTATATVGSCPRTVAEGGVVDPRVGCRSCGTSGEHH
jgi:hypothetical protein